MTKREIKKTELLSENDIENAPLKKGDYVYYAQLLPPPIGEYNVIELSIHTVNVEKKYFTGCDIKGNKHTYLFSFQNLDNYIFLDRKDALQMVKAAEQQYKDVKVSKETEYEEY